MSDKKPHLSASQVEMFSRCARQWEFRYVENRKRPPAVAMIVGTGTHAGIERNMITKMVTHEPDPRDAVAEAAAQSVADEWAKEEPELSADERSVGQNAVYGQSVDTAVNLTLLHYDQLAPSIQPTGVEQEFRLDIGGGFPYDLLGYIDIVDGGVNIRDTKTRARKMAQDEADRSVQATMYHMALDRSGSTPFGVYFDCLLKTKVPGVQTLFTVRDHGDYEQLFRRIESMCRCIEAGVFPPCSPGSWNCSERWCGYWNICEYGAKGKTK